MDFYKEWLGIPDGPRPPDHYELLRVKRFEDEPEKIRAHYKKLNGHVRKYATGQYSVQSQDLLNELAKAMLCLTDPDRKRDYDESLGRELPPQIDEHGRQPLLDILCQQKVISREQKAEVESFADRRGLSHRDAVVQMKLTEPVVAARALAQQLGYSYVDLEDMIPEDDILDLVPRMLVKQHSFIPLFIDDGQLLVACIDMPEHELDDELRLRYEVPVRPVIAAPRSINQAISQYYAPGMRDEAKVKAATAAPPKKGAAKKAAKGKEPPQISGAAKRAAANVAFSQLSPEDQKDRKQWGMLYMMWAFCVPMLPQLLKSMSPALAVQIPIPLMPCLVVAVISTGVTAWWVTQKYWK